MKKPQYCPPVGILHPNQAAHDAPVRLISMKELTKQTCLSKATLCDWMNPGSPNYKPGMPKRFWPSGVNGQGPVRFLQSEVDAWLMRCYTQSQTMEVAA